MTQSRPDTVNHYFITISFYYMFFFASMDNITDLVLCLLKRNLSMLRMYKIEPKNDGKQGRYFVHSIGPQREKGLNISIIPDGIQNLAVIVNPFLHFSCASSCPKGSIFPLKRHGQQQYAYLYLVRLSFLSRLSILIFIVCQYLEDIALLYLNGSTMQLQLKTNARVTE